MRSSKKIPAGSLNFGRSSESRLRRRGEGGQDESSRNYFKTLMSLSITNTYYNRSGDACPDFYFHPTGFTAYLMKALGLIYRQDATHFEVLYNERRQGLLLSYLERLALDPEDPSGSFARLSFVLSLDNPYFANFSEEIPLDLNPALKNFYFSNREVEGTSHALRWSDALEVVGAYPAVFVEPKVASVEVRSLSGELVQCRPRCPAPLRVGINKGLQQVECRDLEYLNTDCENDTVFLNFSLLKEGLYTIDEVTLANQRRGERQQVLYTDAAPIPLCFVDLLFAQPDEVADAGGLYPVSADYTTIQRVDYQLNFNARSTHWRYYVVPPMPGDWEMEIKSDPRSPEVPFTPAVPVDLPDGSPGYLMTSVVPLVLEEDSPYAFQLTGTQTSTLEGLLIERLPVASIQQVLPEHLAFSDIYVYV